MYLKEIIMKSKIMKIIRVATVAPIMALLTMLLLFFYRKSIFGNTINLFLSILFLTVLPLLAYPLQRFMPHYKDQGREGQRNLAIVFAVLGYLFGCISCFFSKAPITMWIIYLEYLLSGLLIFAFTKFFHRKASGHSCGVAGPIALMVTLGVPALIPGILLLALVCWASISMKRHTFGQLVGGTVIPIAVLILLVNII